MMVCLETDGFEMKPFNILLGYDEPAPLEAIGGALEEKGHRIMKVSEAEDIFEAMNYGTKIATRVISKFGTRLGQ